MQHRFRNGTFFFFSLSVSLPVLVVFLFFFSFVGDQVTSFRHLTSVAAVEAELDRLDFLLQLSSLCGCGFSDLESAFD